MPAQGMGVGIFCLSTWHHRGLEPGASGRGLVVVGAGHPAELLLLLARQHGAADGRLGDPLVDGDGDVGHIYLSRHDRVNQASSSSLILLHQ